MATYDILFEETLRVPEVQEKATRQLQSALYNLRSVVRDEQKGFGSHYWNRDYHSSFETAVALRLVELHDTETRIGRTDRFFYSTEKGRQVLQTLEMDGYDFAIPEGSTSGFV